MIKYQPCSEDLRTYMLFCKERDINCDVLVLYRPRFNELKKELNVRTRWGVKRAFNKLYNDVKIKRIIIQEP